jgi:DNA repair protein RecN (Recombination protein N)
MRQLGGHTQVLSITHLPQIAAMGHRHYVLFKITEGDTTSSDIRTVEGDERLQVLAQMIGGAQAGKAAIESAKEFIRMGNKS